VSVFGNNAATLQLEKKGGTRMDRRTPAPNPALSEVSQVRGYERGDFFQRKQFIF